MSKQNPIVVVGAGAAGLMAAGELAKAGKRVIILEARDRCGGRISPLPTQEFGCAAEGGAEFVHGEATLTRSLIKAAGFHYVAIEGEPWRHENGELVKGDRELPYAEVFNRKLVELKKDVPVAAFLEEHFSGKKYTSLRKSIVNLVEGYDAADPARASALALRDELSEQGGSGQQGRVKEGYGALIAFLAKECDRCGCEIELSCRVKAIEHHGECKLHCAGGKTFAAQQAILTIPLPLIGQMEFSPALPRKMLAVREIGFGSIIKIVIHFRRRWWVRARGQDLSALTFLFSDEVIPMWWTQFPEAHATLTGWIGGPGVERFQGMSSENIVGTAFNVLSRVFKTSEPTIRGYCVTAKVLDWSADPFTQGAYSYATVKTKNARRELTTVTEGDRVFFAGEALTDGTAASTVEGALVSGRDVAKRILSA